MTDTPEVVAGAMPNIYFIDDSATMRAVVKIAFRRENFNVVTFSDMASAVAQFDQTRPDAVISDVIMPDKDGYQLCQYVKQHTEFHAIPVILLSGVVNREVAEKADQVKADELIRKPFHPQDLVTRIKKLLHHEGAEASAVTSVATKQPEQSAPPNPLVSLFGFPVTPLAARAEVKGAPPTPAEVLKLRMEIQRLESLVKKLQSQLETEHEYCAALESQLRNFSESRG